MLINRRSFVTSGLYSTVQFVGVTAFHTQIADPLIGGTYMTASTISIRSTRGVVLTITQSTAPEHCHKPRWDLAKGESLPPKLFSASGTLKQPSSLPQPVVLKGIDYFSRSSCRIKEESGVISLRGSSRHSRETATSI